MTALGWDFQMGNERTVAKLIIECQTVVKAQQIRCFTLLYQEKEMQSPLAVTCRKTDHTATLTLRIPS